MLIKNLKAIWHLIWCGSSVLCLGDQVSRRGALTGGYYDTRWSRLDMQKSKMELATAKLQQETEYQSHRVELEKMEQYITNLLSEMQKLETRNSKNKWGIFLIVLMLSFGCHFCKPWHSGRFYWCTLYIATISCRTDIFMTNACFHIHFHAFSIILYCLIVLSCHEVVAIFYDYYEIVSYLVPLLLAISVFDGYTIRRVLMMNSAFSCSSFLVPYTFLFNSIHLGVEC